MEAANLTVSITGDASGLEKAITAANASLGRLKESAASVIAGTAEQKNAILKSAGVMNYAPGVKNDMFKWERDNFESYKKSSNVSLEEQISWWRDTLNRYAYDYEVVKDCNEEIFALTRKLADSINNLSDIYIDERTYFNDWSEYGDSATACMARIKENNKAFLDEGTITYGEYTENVKRAGEKLYEGRIEQSKRWLKQEMSYNNMSLTSYIEGLERMAAYTKEYFENGLIGYKEYAEGLQSINNSIADAKERLRIQKENENAAEYAHWQSDAVNWKKMRDTYGDWSDYGDSPVQFYERCIDRVKEFYDAGKIGWQQYMDDVFGYQLDLYNAQLETVDKAIDTQRKYIAEVKARLQGKEAALKESWETGDRNAEIADISAQLQVYKFAVTERGKNKYAELKQQLTKLERDKELSELQKENNAIITRLEQQLDAAEANKRGLLNSINARGLNTNVLVASIVRDTSTMQGFLSGMFANLIRAIEKNGTSTSYTDNSSKTYNIATGVSQSLKAIANVVGASFLYKF